MKRNPYTSADDCKEFSDTWSTSINPFVSCALPRPQSFPRFHDFNVLGCSSTSIHSIDLFWNHAAYSVTCLIMGKQNMEGFNVI